MSSLEYRKPTAEEIAWACGLFEGEGSVFLLKKGQYGKASLRMTDREPVVEFLRIVAMGTVDGPYQPKSKNGRKLKPHWGWRLGGKENIERLFELFQARLSPRRIAQFQTVLAACKSKFTWPDGVECGLASYYGYVCHIRRKEAPCAPCREAARRYSQSRRKSVGEVHAVTC
jgi:hypothetical protein